MDGKDARDYFRASGETTFILAEIEAKRLRRIASRPEATLADIARYTVAAYEADSAYLAWKAGSRCADGRAGEAEGEQS